MDQGPYKAVSSRNTTNIPGQTNDLGQNKEKEFCPISQPNFFS